MILPRHPPTRDVKGIAKQRIILPVLVLLPSFLRTMHTALATRNSALDSEIANTLLPRPMALPSLPLFVATMLQCLATAPNPSKVALTRPLLLTTLATLETHRIFILIINRTPRPTQSFRPHRLILLWTRFSIGSGVK